MIFLRVLQSSFARIFGSNHQKKRKNWFNISDIRFWWSWSKSKRGQKKKKLGQRTCQIEWHLGFCLACIHKQAVFHLCLNKNLKASQDFCVGASLLIELHLWTPPSPARNRTIASSPPLLFLLSVHPNNGGARKFYEKFIKILVAKWYIYSLLIVITL